MEFLLPLQSAIALKDTDYLYRWCNNLMSSKAVVVGDFNLPYIDWSNMLLKSRHNPQLHESFIDCLDFVEASDFTLK